MFNLHPAAATLKDLASNVRRRDFIEGKCVSPHAKELLSECQGMERRTRVSIKSMEEGSLYIHGGWWRLGRMPS